MNGPDYARGEEILTFGSAYTELKTITDELNTDADLDPDEMLAKLARGKALETAVRERLTEAQEQVQSIERGEFAGPTIRIARTGEEPTKPASATTPVDTSDFAATPVAPPEDDIPF